MAKRKNKYKDEEFYGFGFELEDGIKIMKALPKDVNSIVNLYDAKSARGIEIWREALEEEKRDEANFTFVIQNPKGNVIGVISSETEDELNYVFDVWIPNLMDRREFLDDVVSGLIDWVEQERTDILRINLIRAIKGQILAKNFEVLERDIEFYAQ